MPVNTVAHAVVRTLGKASTAQSREGVALAGTVALLISHFVRMQ